MTGEASAEKQMIDIRITRDTQTKIYVKTEKRWEQKLAAISPKEPASPRLKETFKVKETYRVPKLLATGQTMTIDGVDVMVKDDFGLNYLIAYDPERACLCVNMAVFRIAGITEGVECVDASLLTEKQLTVATKALIKRFREAYLENFKPFEIIGSLTVRDLAIEPQMITSATSA